MDFYQDNWRGSYCGQNFTIIICIYVCELVEFEDLLLRLHHTVLIESLFLAASGESEDPFFLKNVVEGKKKELQWVEQTWKKEGKSQI